MFPIINAMLLKYFFDILMVSLFVNILSKSSLKM